VSVETPERASRGPWLTERDLTALSWIGEQFAVRTDTLGYLLGRLGPDAETGQTVAASVVRRRVARWEEAGWARRHYLLGRPWVVPTRAGLALAADAREDRADEGLGPFDAWVPTSAATLDHLHLCAVVRLLVEATEPGVIWRSERRVRAEWRAAGRKGVKHCPDAELLIPAALGARTEWVEVELHRKREGRYADLFTYLPGGIDVIRWYTPPAMLSWLERTVHKHAGAAHRSTLGQRIIALPELGTFPGQAP